MEYSIQKLAKLAGISTRTLRYYDEIGLLKPLRINSSGYRIYGEKEVDALQQILFFKELGLSLAEIQKAVTDPSFNRLEALKQHLNELESERKRLDLLMQNVKHTIEKEEGEYEMSNKEKFEGLKISLIEGNEKKYGAEIRERYGEEAVENSNAKLMGLNKEEYQRMEELGNEIKELLEEAVKAGETADGESGKKAAMLHKEWLSFTWISYSVEAHHGLVSMYTEDERFKAYYDSNVDGCAEFLKQAVQTHFHESR